MPLMQSATSTMNAAFAPDAVDSFPEDAAANFHVDSGASLSDALGRIPGVDLPGAVAEFIDTWPSGLQIAVRSVIHHNLTRGAKVPITFAWTPGYDYSVQIFDVVDTDSSRGGITVLLTSRYPAHTHPLKLRGGGA